MSSSKLFVSIAAILFLFTSLFYAQSDSVGYKSQLQFHLVNGYSLSYLNSLSNSSALRYKLDFNLSVGKENSDGSVSSSSSNFYSSNSTSGSNESNSQMVNFAVQYLWYPLDESLVRVFLGVGPVISLNRSFGHRSEDQTLNDGSKYYNSTETLQYSLGIGLGGVAAVECFVTRRISLIGEYGILGNYSWGKQKYSNKYNPSANQPVSEYTNESNSHGWNIGSGNLRLGIAFRF